MVILNTIEMYVVIILLSLILAELSKSNETPWMNLTGKTIAFLLTMYLLVMLAFEMLKASV